MGAIRKVTQQPTNKKQAYDLYSKYMTLALATRSTGNRVLFEDYYQCAEHYLHMMNKLDESFLTTSSSPKASTSLMKKRVDLKQKTVFHKDPLGQSTRYPEARSVGRKK